MKRILFTIEVFALMLALPLYTYAELTHDQGGKESSARINMESRYGQTCTASQSLAEYKMVQK